MFYSYFNNILSKSIVNILIFLGPVYVKLGQVLALEYPILKDLNILQDDCGPLNKTHLEFYIKKYKNLNIEKKYYKSGSIAVIHKCNYNNKECIVKLKRKDIDKKIKRNISQIKTMLSIIGYLFPSYVKKGIITKINYTIEQYLTQTDFYNEINNWDDLNNIIKQKTVIIPYLYKEISNNEIIVMDFIPGKNIIKDKNIILKNKDLLYELDTIFFGLFSTFVIYNIFHADLHPGNFSFTEDNKIILYDFGLCYNFNTDTPNNNFIMEMMYFIMKKDINELLRILVDKYIEEDQTVKDKIYSQLYNDDSISTLKKIINNDFTILDIINFIKNVIYENNVNLSNSLIQTEFIFISIFNTIDKFKLLYKLKLEEPPDFNNKMEKILN